MQAANAEDISMLREPNERFWIIDGIAKYMRSQVGPAYKDLKSAADFKTFVSKDEVGVVAFLVSFRSIKLE